jgi:hypothetical protein
MLIAIHKAPKSQGGMKTFRRRSFETFKSLVALILGISVLSIICYLFMFPQLLYTSTFPSETGKEVLVFILGSLGTGRQLLLVAAPIWIIAWLPLRLKQLDSASPWSRSRTIFVAAAVGAVSGVIEGAALVFYFGHIASNKGEPAIVYIIFSVFGFVLGGLGGALIGAAEILTSRWFMRQSGDSSGEKAAIEKQ